MRSFSSFPKYRKWPKVVEPLVKYNRDSCDLGYPLDFFYYLEHSISSGLVLNLNIATTLTGSKDNCIKTVFNDNQEVGRVVFQPSVLKSSFDTEIEKQMQERLTKFSERDVQFDSFYSSIKQTSACDQLFPLAVLKQKEEGGKCRVLTLSRDEFKKIINLQSQQLAQCFVFGSGKQTSIIRFFYSPLKQKSEAFKIDNLEGFMKRKFCKNQFKVREQNQHSLTFVKIMHSNKSFYQQCLTLVDFLEKHKKITISKIVTDWILDPNNRYYLVDVKEVSYTQAQANNRPLKSLTDTLAFITCEVCQQKFREEEVNKVLTRKLIQQFFQHLQKRQCGISFNIPFKPTAGTSKVCDLCYMLVVSESSLMELQKKIAVVTHSITPNHSPAPAVVSGKLGRMFEWRLFLFLEDIRELQIQGIEPKSSYYVMLKLHNSVTAFRIKKPNQKYHSIKGIKINYLFSEGEKIDKFLVSSQIIIRITKGNNWNSVIAQGSTSGLYEENEKHSMRKFKQILVFNQKSQYSVVGVHIGVKLEGRHDPSCLSLHKAHDLYMVDDGYSNCYALHAEWMETIDPSYCISKTQSNTFSYGLHLQRAERRIMLPSLVPKNKKKLIL